MISFSTKFEESSNNSRVEVRALSLPISFPFGTLETKKLCEGLNKHKIKARIAFFELTKRLFKIGSTDVVDQVAKVAFIQKLKNYNNREYDLSKLVDALKTGDIKNAVFSDLDDMAYLSLWAVYEGLIDVTTFTNLMIIRETLLCYDNVTFMPIFTNYGYNRQARNVIEDTNSSSSKAFLTPSELDTIFQNLESDPNTAFILTGIEKTPLAADDISLRILNSLSSNTLNRSQDGTLCVIPSLNMMQAVIEVRSKDKNFKINPVLGPSSYDQIAHNGLHSRRDLQVSFPGAPTPERPHDLSSFGVGFMKHDFYHAVLSSSCERNMPLTFIFMSQVLATLRFDEALEKVKVNMVKRLIDFEVTSARREIHRPSFLDDKLNHTELFLSLFELFVRSSLLNRGKNEYEAEQVNKYFVVLTILFKKLLEIKKSGNDWDKELKLDLSTINFIESTKKRKTFSSLKLSAKTDSMQYDVRENSAHCVVYNALQNSGLLYYFEKELAAPYIHLCASTHDEHKTLKKLPLHLQNCLYTLTNDFNVVLYAVLKDGRALKYASPELRGDKKIVEHAVRTYGAAIKYASPELQDDEEIVMNAGLDKNSYEFFCFVSPRLAALQTVRHLFLTMPEQEKLALKGQKENPIINIDEYKHSNKFQKNIHFDHYNNSDKLIKYLSSANNIDYKDVKYDKFYAQFYKK